MARKKKNTKVVLPELPESGIHIGTPTIALLAAKNYRFTVHSEEHKITVPRSGSYHELDPSTYKKEDGEFMLFDEKSKVMYLPAISKVLFATKQYPDLKPTQIFAPMAFVFKDDEVDIIGQVIEMLPVE